MTELFKQQLQELIDQAAEKYSEKGLIGDWSMQGNFKQGCEFLMPLLMKAVEQRNQNAYGYPEDENKELLNILKGDE